MFTNDCTTSCSSVKIAKFADDTTLVGLITDGNETAYRNEISELVNWCSNNNLLLNASKTKEIIVDFRKNKSNLSPILISNEPIEIVENFKFLGTIISYDLKWQNNIDETVKKAHQRLYFLRQLRKFSLSTPILAKFYRSVIESILTFSIIVWYGNISESQKGSLDKIVKIASKIIGSDLPTLESIYLERIRSKSNKILKDKSHPANYIFELLPSGRRFRSIKCKTSRMRNSFFSKAINALNQY